WGSGKDDVWAVGQVGPSGPGTIVHWNGTAWSVAATPNAGVSGVWGSAPNAVWAVGDSNSIEKYDGMSWSQVMPQQNSNPHDLSRVWGSGPNDVWATSNDTLFKYGGEVWSVVANSQGGTGIWGTAANDVWTVGFGGSISHYDGHKW